MRVNELMKLTPPAHHLLLFEGNSIEPILLQYQFLCFTYNASHIGEIDGHKSQLDPILCPIFPYLGQHPTNSAFINCDFGFQPNSTVKFKLHVYIKTCFIINFFSYVKNEH